MDKSRRTVMVTGCSSGIGRATALQLANYGFQVFAGVRREQHMDNLWDLKRSNLVPILLDVTQDDDAARAVATIEKDCPQGLSGLVNNAGVGLPAAVELSHLDEVRQLFEVNTVAPLRMIQHCLPLLRKTRGRVINMSSMNGTLALPMVGAYSASKFALEALSDTLRVELRPWQISVSLIRPGQVRTSIFDKARDDLQQRTGKIPAELKSGYDIMYARAGDFNERGAKAITTPEQVARVVQRALTARRPRTHYTVGMDAHGLQCAKWLTPWRLIDRSLARVMGVLKPLP
ncbi:MAG: short-chain dehydrogenase/reductase [Planctomycetaceae bacterium]|nr:short-chain dehydrogenase/reductase [Planctomycetaceae bacterium]